jgi:lysophospholipase L1-like esterase
MSTPMRDWWPHAFQRVAILGESTVEGGDWVPARADRYADILVELLNRVQAQPVEYLNCGIGASVISPRSPGYDASKKPSALERFEQDVVAQKPDLFIMAYGLNDMRAGMDLEVFMQDMEHIVRRVQETCGSLVVLVSVYHMTGFGWYPPFDRGSSEATLRYNAAIQALADKLGCLYADVRSAEGPSDWVVHQDGVHANVVGNLLIANKIFEVLATNCSGLSTAVRTRDETTRWTAATRAERFGNVEPVKE